MKRIFRKAFWLIIGFAPVTAFAQQLPQMPLDPGVRYGQLENGLTYYIRHNELPKDRAEFYIAQKVGSVLEEDNQRGLAHFLEHMAFNGTKNFPGKSMLNYLEQNGVKFGTNVNAYTSIDETVYNLSNVPTTNLNLVDSCLLILHDWSGFISLEEKEIDSERAVIHEEWRTRSNPFLRMYENIILPTLYPNNRYGVRMPIGTMEVVDNFPYQALRDYYHKWYRPDLQGIIIVGDVDVDAVEKRIKEMWQDIPKPVDPAERVFFAVEDNKEPLVAVASDKEAPRNIMSVMFKHDPLPAEQKNTQIGMLMAVINDMIGTMLNNRYEELTQKADAPFMGASGEYGEYIFAQTKDAFSLNLMFKEGEWKAGLDALIAVANSAKEFGFTASEYERAKAELLSQLENAYNEKDKVKNQQYVTEYLGHFLKAEPTPGIDMEYMMLSQVLPQLPLEQINAIMKQYITPENVAIMMMGVEKDGMAFPTKDDVLEAFNKANAVAAVAYEDKVSNEPLLSQLPKAGKVKKTGEGNYGTTVWTLSNGAKVIFKPTDFKKDQIVMTAFSAGGTSLLPQADLINSKVIDDVIGLSGVGAFSATELNKALAGKRVSVAPYIGGISEGIQANCAPKDFETMLQLSYLYFTAQRKDEDAFQAWKKRTATMLDNMGSNPQVVFSDSLTATMYAHHPAKKRIVTEDLEKIDYNRILDIQKERFANAGDFTFVFVGNINPEEVKPMVEQYIASLPAKGKKETFKKVEPLLAEGVISNRFTTPMATPKVSVYNILSGTVDFNLENNLKMTMLKQIMDIVYTETIREQEGGTYGVGTQGSLKINPKGQFMFLYGFDTGEEKRERLEKRAYEELALIAENGPKAEVFNKVKEYLLKKNAEEVMENSYWMDVISMKERFNHDGYTGYSDIVNSLTPDAIRDFAAQILKSGNRIEVVCTGVQQN
ncbi:MAG: insulinase family protein [Bacteroidales bacterium]